MLYLLYNIIRKKSIKKQKFDYKQKLFTSKNIQIHFIFNYPHNVQHVINYSLNSLLYLLHNHWKQHDIRAV